MTRRQRDDEIDRQEQTTAGYYVKRSPSCSSLLMDASKGRRHRRRQHNGYGNTSSSSTGRSATFTKGSRSNEFDESNDSVMIHPSSPCGTPPRKRWEMSFNSFLRGKNQHQHTPPTLSSPPSGSSSFSSTPTVEHNEAKGIKKKSSFSLLPGSRRLVSRINNTSSNNSSNSNNIPNRSTSSKPISALSSIFSKRGNATTTATAATNGVGCTTTNDSNNNLKSMDELDVPLRNGMIRISSTNSVPKFCGAGGSKSDLNFNCSPPTRPQFNSTTTRRQHKPFSFSTGTSVLESASTQGSFRGNSQIEQQESQKQHRLSCSVQNDQLTDNSNAKASDDAFTPLNRKVSIDWLAHPIVNEGVKSPSVTMSTPCLREFGSNNRITDQDQQPMLHAVLPINNHCRIPSSLTDYHEDVGLNLDDSDSSHMDDDERHHRHQLSSSTSYNNQSNINTINTINIESTCGILEPPDSIDDIFRGEDMASVVTVVSESFSSNNSLYQYYNNHNRQNIRNNLYHQHQSQHQLPASLETKKVFTKIHNSTKYNQGDSTVIPFLGGKNKASNVDLVSSVHNSYVSHYNAMLIDGRKQQQQNQQQDLYASIPHLAKTSCTIAGTTVRHQQQEGSTASKEIHEDEYDDQNPNSTGALYLSKSLPLDTLDELKYKSTRKNYSKGRIRLLKPILGAESWMPGRRYLIAPAVLASCPLSTINSLSDSSSAKSATEAAAAASISDFTPIASGMVVLGEAHMTYVGDKYHLTNGEWSSCKLVLRQNYLFEYDLESPLSSLPRGLAHLRHAVAYPHKDFQDALELRFYASPCAKVDHRIVIIRVENNNERDHWITCLNNAAKLQIKDIWDFDTKRPIGTGRYASIYAARRRRSAVSSTISDSLSKGKEDDDRCDHSLENNAYTNRIKNDCALKIIDKNEFWRLVLNGRERCDTIVRELAVQSTLTAAFGAEYNNFLQIYGFFESSDKIVIEMELLDGRDLFEYISSKEVLDEDEAGFIVRDILVALSNMKQIGIAHRDIKPANIFMTDESNYGTSVKLGDFGMSALVGLDGLLRGRCGSPGYVSPEILLAEAGQGYENKIDIFSAGVTLYVMLCGYEPFYGEDEKELIEANKYTEVDFPNIDWCKISPEARDLVERMLKRNPTERITAKDALDHDWITGLDPKQKEERITPKRDSHKMEGICTIM